jgi:Zn-dependent protease
MSLFTPDVTRYDLNFRVLGFPVRVHPGFVIVHAAIALLLACAPLIAGKLGALVVFCVCFVCTAGSILLRELGHVLVGRRFGADGEVVLTFWGGFAGTGIEAHSHQHRILTTLAGPAMSFVLAVLAGVGYEASRLSREEIRAAFEANPEAPFPESGYGRSLASFATLVLLCINAPAAVYSMIPIKPLDGGMILQDAIEWYKFGERPGWERDADWWKRSGPGG